MKRSCRFACGLIAAFGAGVLLSIVLPSRLILIITLVVLILLAVYGCNPVRG